MDRVLHLNANSHTPKNSWVRGKRGQEEKGGLRDRPCGQWVIWGGAPPPSLSGDGRVAEGTRPGNRGRRGQGVSECLWGQRPCSGDSGPLHGRGWEGRVPQFLLSPSALPVACHKPPGRMRVKALAARVPGAPRALTSGRSGALAPESPPRHHTQAHRAGQHDEQVRRPHAVVSRSCAHPRPWRGAGGGVRAAWGAGHPAGAGGQTPRHRGAAGRAPRKGPMLQRATWLLRPSVELPGMARAEDGARGRVSLSPGRLRAVPAGAGAVFLG